MIRIDWKATIHAENLLSPSSRFAKYLKDYCSIYGNLYAFIISAKLYENFIIMFRYSELQNLSSQLFSEFRSLSLNLERMSHISRQNAQYSSPVCICIQYVIVIPICEWHFGVFIPMDCTAWVTTRESRIVILQASFCVDLIRILTILDFFKEVISERRDHISKCKVEFFYRPVIIDNMLCLFI
jgi:hypothetical protein